LAAGWRILPGAEDRTREGSTITFPVHGRPVMSVQTPGTCTVATCAGRAMRYLPAQVRVNASRAVVAALFTVYRPVM
jgi:hypothetical protein